MNNQHFLRSIFLLTFNVGSFRWSFDSRKHQFPSVVGELFPCRLFTWNFYYQCALIQKLSFVWIRNMTTDVQAVICGPQWKLLMLEHTFRTNLTSPTAAATEALGFCSIQCRLSNRWRKNQHDFNMWLELKWCRHKPNEITHSAGTKKGLSQINPRASRAADLVATTLICPFFLLLLNTELGSEYGPFRV